MKRFDGRTADATEENINKLKAMFPEIITEDYIDFDKLRTILGEDINDEFEKYEFKWKGKMESMRLAGLRSSATLLPCKEESKDWDNTGNLYLEGDNLEVLKLLRQSYHGRIKMIYIDPPYNTGNDFVYKDSFSDSLDNYKEITEQSGKSNPETSGRYHTNWLNMMYPRLLVAKSLLREDGVIFISIDDNEVHNLRKLCDEVFGEDNFVASIIWKRKRGRDNSARWFSKSHEYLIIYAKNKDLFDTNYLELDSETRKAYKNPDNDPRGDYRILGCWARGTQGGVEYDFTDKNNQYFSKRLWLFSKENLLKLDKEDKLIINNDNIYRKMFLTENKGKIPETLWDNVSNAANASDEIKNIFNNILFDTPKPIPYLCEMLKIATNHNDIILDFFSGSSTTAHAVMQLNAEDGGNRKFIMVQLPEKTDEKSEAYRVGYKNICEIGKERIRRAGDKILNEIKKNTPQWLNYTAEKDAGKTNANLTDIKQYLRKADTAAGEEENPIDEGSIAGQNSGLDQTNGESMGKSRKYSGEKPRSGIVENETFNSRNPSPIKTAGKSDLDTVTNLTASDNTPGGSDEGKTISESLSHKDLNFGKNSYFGESMGKNEKDAGADDVPASPLPDVGFKVFKLASSNIKRWDSSPLGTTENMVERVLERLNNMMETIRPDRAEQDVVYEVILKLGFTLDEPVEKIDFEGVSVYAVGEGPLFLVCLEPDISIESVRAMVDSGAGTIIFAGDCFKTDTSIVNAELILKDKNMDIRVI